MTRTTWSFYCPPQLLFGRGAVEQLGELAARHQWRKLLVVSDRNLESAGLVDRVLAPLHRASLETTCFLDGQAEPEIAVAVAAAECARQARPDAIVGLGGGSNLDLAKITAIALQHGGKVSDYVGFDQVPGPVAPLICVPTTSGTGSEVSHAAVLTDAQAEMKVSTLSHYIRPQLAVVDPALTDQCPRQVTADSGIDALTHAIEAVTATRYDALALAPGESCAYEGCHPLGKLLGEEAIGLIGRHLRAAVETGEAPHRDAMALAATLAGQAFSNCGVALVHALEYPLGGELHCSHGAGNGLLLPYVMRFNLPEREAELARIGELLGVPESRTASEGAERAIAAVEALRRQIGIPQRIRELGAKPEQLPQFAAKAYQIKRLRLINPRPASEQDLLQILQAAY